jgi:hypothetical protein
MPPSASALSFGEAQDMPASALDGTGIPPGIFICSGAPSGHVMAGLKIAITGPFSS